MEVTIELATTTESEEGELVPDRRWKFWPIVPKHLPIRRRTRKHNQNPVVLSNKDPSNRVRPTSNGVATPQAKEILSPVQRLRQREFMSKKNLRLVEQNDYDQCLIDKRDVLWQYVHDISHDSDAARVSRNLIERYSATFDLVSVQSADLKRITPYICVYGVPDDEILKLHAALSKTEFRSQYKELSLCYDTNPVIGHASKKPMSGMDISDLTLCGRTAIFKDGAGYQTRTIAFLLESVALKSSSSPDYYALTAFHGSDIAHKDTPPEVHLDDLLEDESSFESDVSSALIVTGKASALVRVPPDDSSSGDNIDNPDISISSIPSTQIGLGTANFPLNEIYTGREWSLVSIKDPLLCLPNAVRFPVIQTRSDENDTEAYYLNNDSIVTSPKTAEVVVIAGVSGQHTARLRQRSIQINFQGSGMIEAWVVQFPGVCPLVKGDSGSPVIDAKTRRAYGYIFASTGNRAFLRPLHHAISEIQKQITSTVRLPSPFQCLAEVSRHYPKTGSSSSTAELFALEAIGKRALLASSGTRTVDIYRKNWKNPLNRTTLAWLVTKTGSNAFSTTAKDAKFWSDAMEMRDNNPQFDYELLKSLFSEDGPPGEEQIVVTPISQDQSQVSASQTVLTSAVMPSVPAERETPANIFVNKLPRVRKRLKNFRTTLTATRAGRNSTSKPNNDAEDSTVATQARMSESDQESHQYRKLLNLLDGNDFDRAVLYSSFIGFFSVSYQLILSSLTQPLIDMVYYYPGNLSSTSVLFLRVSILFGMLIGQLFFGFFADLFGRKPLFTSQLFLLTLATCGIAMASRGEVYSTSLFGWLVSWRLILGIGIGAEYPISALLTCEFIAPRRRTRMLSTVFAAQPFGFLGAVAVTSIVVIAYGGSIPRLVGENTCNSHECRLPLDRAWRVVIATGLIPVYVAHFLRQILPESPMYTASVLKRPDKAISNYRKGFIFWGKRRLKSHDANDAQFVAHAESLRDRLDHFDSEMIELDTIELRNSVSVRDLTPSQVLPRRETLARCRSSTLSSSKEPFSDVALRVYWSGLYEYLFRDGQWPKLLGVSLASLFFGATYYPLVQLAAVTISSKLFRQAPPGTGCTFQNGITLDTWPAQFDVAPNCTSLATRRSLRTGVTSYLWQFVLVLCLGLILGAFFIPLLGQRLSPRRTQILGFWSTTLSLFLAGAVFRFADGSTTVSLNVFLFALVTATIGFTGGPIFTLPAELFTIQYRGFCYGFAAASGQIGAIALQAVLHVVDFRNSTGSHTSSETGTIWLGTALLYLSLVAFAGVIFTSVFIPETDFHSRTLAFKWPKIPRPGRALVRLRNWRRHDL